MHNKDRRSNVGSNENHVSSGRFCNKVKTGFKNKKGLIPMKKDFKNPNYQQNNNQLKKA